MSLVCRVWSLMVLLLLVPSPVGAATEYYPPLDSQVDLSSLPADAVQPVDDGGQPIPKRLRVKHFLYEELKDAGTEKDIGAKLTLDLLVSEVFELAVPGLENALTLAFATGAMHAELTLREEHANNPEDDYPFILTLIPGEHLVSVRFKSDLLKPVQPVTYQPYSGTPPRPELLLDAGVKIQVRYSWEGEPELQLIDSGGLRPRLSLSTPVMVGDTGMVLEIEDAELDLSRTSSPPGRPAAWIGVAFEKLAINFTNGLEVPRVEHGEGAAPPPASLAGITVSDFSVGSGGVTGGLCGNLSAGPTLPLFGSSFQAQRICITLEEGALTAGEVVGVLSEFPYFKAPVKLSLALALDGNFKVALAPPDPAQPTVAAELTIPGVLVYRLEALSIERKAALYIWKSSGKLNVDALSSAPADAIAVNGLTVTSAGEVTLDGGWLVLPQKKDADFKGFRIELSEIGFGTEMPGTPDAQAWVGFSGSVELSQGFDAASRFKRLQFLFPGHGSPVDVRLQGVEVAFEKPGVVSFMGAVDFFKDPTTGAEGFAGALECNVEAIRLAVAARLVVGKATPPTGTPFPFFYIDLAAQLPTGIPLYGNVSLYGFLGLFAYNVGPNLQAFTTPVKWFEAHRIATNVLAGVPAPWKVQNGAFAVGAGAILGTTVDDGFTVNTKLAVMVSIPGPVVMLQGAANIIKQRGELTSTTAPNFVALAIFDGITNTFLINIGAYYTVENLIDVKGEAEAFYNLEDPNDWHLWIGKDQPEDRRIRAEVLSFLKANAYFMIDPTGLGQGAKAGYDEDWKFGPLRVRLEAFFAYDMDLFFRPAHVWGEAQVKGDVELKAFGVGVGLCANATLQGESPKPMYIDGSFRVKLSLPWPLPDPSATVHLRWEKPADKVPVEELVGQLGVEPRKGGYTIRPAVQALSGNTSRSAPPASIPASSLCTPGQSVPAAGQTQAECARPLVPLDVMLVAAFQRPTNDVNDLGWGNPFDAAHPLHDVLGDTQFQYDIEGLELVQAQKGGATLNFDTPLTDLYGAWPALAGGENPAPLYLKVLSRNPLDVYKSSTYLFYENGTKGWTEWAADTYGNDYCHERGGVPAKRLAAAVLQPARSDDPPRGCSSDPPRGCSSDPPRGCSSDPTPGNDKDCIVPPDLITREDFILPPYSAFRFTVDGDVTRSTSGPDRIYRGTSIFHTEGPPLDLAPYVDVTFPATDRRPHYRGYDVGVRFNDTYLDLMYREGGQRLQVQILDDNDMPATIAGSEVTIVTNWDQARDHVPRPTEDDWLEFLRSAGVPVDAVIPKDDRIFGQLSSPAALRSNERYRVRVWLDDPRLAQDSRLGDATWLETHPVRFHTETRVVLHEFPFLTSQFVSFADLVGSYPGNYLEQAVSTTSNLTTLATLAARAGAAVSAFPSTLGNGSGVELGRFLRHALAPQGPAEVSELDRFSWIRRAPGYSGKPERMTETEQQSLLSNWENALAAYELLEKELGLETFRNPLPRRFEVRALTRGSDVVGLLCESPEALDFARIALATQQVPGTPETPQLVPNRDGTRFFVFRLAGGAVQPWTPDLWALQFTYRREVGTRYPVLRAPDGLSAETPTLVVDLPHDRFTL